MTPMPDLSPEARNVIIEAAGELIDIGTALGAQDEAWFHGNASLGDYYQQLAGKLRSITEAKADA